MKSCAASNIDVNGASGKKILTVVLCAGLIGSGPSAMAQGTNEGFLKPAEAFDPHCPGGDRACEAWAGFRAGHPYPYQAIQGKRLPDGSLAILLSEPPPSLSKKDLDTLIRKAFGADLKSLSRRRWRMGADGWLEDVVLQVEAGTSSGDPLSDPTVRDRIAFLNLALFGTALGSGLDMLGEHNVPEKPESAPNLKISPFEIKEWMTDGKLLWRPLSATSPSPLNWKEISAGKITGTFVSQDNSLVVLAIPGSLLRGAKDKPASLDVLRVPFREFAIATDTITGILQDPNGHVAVLGRWRTRPLADVTPLRFETFKLIASQTSDELSQSYERGALFAGKLDSGDYEERDWAPIYLSESLVDTEFGALLNTTDQLLKSWSEAGTIEYLYFNYPRPKEYPFGRKPLSEVVEKLTGSGEVLFNWNTAGAGVLVDTKAGKILTATQTGALPVTYGSDSNLSGALEAGHLQEQEEKAYNYFAGSTDPNLARVVAYTMLYQFCRGLGPPTSAPIAPKAKQFYSAAMKARRDAAGVRVAATLSLLRDLRSNRVELPTKSKTRVTEALKKAGDRYPAYTDAQLANLLADRFSVESLKLAANRKAQMAALSSTLSAEENDYNARARLLQTRIDAFNGKVKSTVRIFVDDSQAEKLSAEKRAIERLAGSLSQFKTEIEKKGKDLDAFIELLEHDPLDELRELLAQVAADQEDLDAVRQEFLSKNTYEPEGSIKTPSIVLSWNTGGILEELFSTGGHNVDARTLKFEPDTSVAGVEIVLTEKGAVLHFNPAKAAAVESNANQLARLVEHQGVQKSEYLTAIISRVTPRSASKTEALALPNGPRSPVWSGRIGERVYEGKSEMVGDLRTMAEKNGCCVFVAQDNEGVAFATEQNLKPPPLSVAYEIHDSSSMSTFMRRVAQRTGTQGERAIVFLDTPESHVKAAAMSLTDGKSNVGLSQMAETLGARRAGIAEARVDAVKVRDLKDRASTLRSLPARIEAKARELFDSFASKQSRESWTRTEISVLPRDAAAEFVSDLDWNTAEHGIPNAVMVKFAGTKASARPIDLGFVAGFANGESAAGQTAMKAVADRNMAIAMAKQASLAEYAATVRNDIELMTGLHIRKLAVVVKEGETKTLFTLHLQEDSNTHVRSASNPG